MFNAKKVDTILSKLTNIIDELSSVIDKETSHQEKLSVKIHDLKDEKLLSIEEVDKATRVSTKLKDLLS